MTYKTEYAVLEKVASQARPISTDDIDIQGVPRDASIVALDELEVEGLIRSLRFGRDGQHTCRYVFLTELGYLSLDAMRCAKQHDGCNARTRPH